MCAYQMTSLAQLLHYTSLSQALFSKPLSPIGPAQPSRGECDQENSPLNLPRWTPCLFWFIYLFYPFLVCFLSYSPMLSNSDCLSLESTVMLICSIVLYLLFWFVVLIIVQPPNPLSLFCYSCSLCVIEFSPGCYSTPVGCVSHMEC